MKEAARQVESNDSGDRTRTERIGQIVGGTYRIARYLRSGGSSHVFEVEHLRLGKSFALKLLRADIDLKRNAARRFRREGPAIAKLNDEHVVSVADCGELADGTPYLVTELLAGEDLRSLLDREQRLCLRRAAEIVFGACQGLSAVHGAGLVHRDLKPENLFVARASGGADCCKILDFGVAKLGAGNSTAQGAIVGTVRYMAPEQLAGSNPVGPTADIYALGAVLYECVAGRPLFDGDTVESLMYAVMNREPESLAVAAPEVPAAVAAVVASCIAKDPAQRPQTAAEFAAQLRAALFGLPPGHATQHDGEQMARPRRGASVHGRLGSVLALLSLLCIAAGAGWLGGRRSVRAVDAVPPRAVTPAADVTPAPRDVTSAAGIQAAPPARTEVEATSGAELVTAPVAARPVHASKPRSAPVAAASAAFPKIQFELQNPYAKR